MSKGDSMTESFKDILRDENRIILFDGAMGTYLYQKGFFLNINFEQLNITNPDTIREVHEEYIKAGADVIKTNTFGANSFKLEKAGLLDQLADINRAGVKLARECAKKAQTFVAGSVGPIGKLVHPLGPITGTQARSIYEEQIEILIDAGVDIITLETFTDLRELQIAVETVKKISSDVPVIAHLSVTEDGTSILGATPDQLAELAYKLNIDAVGFNCSVGPHHMLKPIEHMKQYKDLVISVHPNAGVPRIIDDRSFYLTTPEYFTEYARRYLLNNVRIVGGCCGIHPEHIKQLKYIVKSVVLGIVAAEEKDQSEISVQGEHPGMEPVPASERSHFAKRLCRGDFVSSVEITPPKGCDPTKVIEAARYLKAHGVDAVNIPDGPRASARMGPQMLAIILEREVKMETIIHYCCRDRNVIGMQSDLLGVAAAGLRNILAITGDPPKLGHYPNATAVFDVDAIGLVRIINKLNHGLDLADNDISNTTKFFVGVGVNPVASNYELELARFFRKVESGADFAVTQPVFDPDRLNKFLDDIHDIDIPVLIGIWPLASYRNAEFLNSEIPEITIPDYILERMKKVTDKEAAKLEGVAIARETLFSLKSRIQGVQVSAPFGRADLAVKVLEGIITPDPEYHTE
ncbi:MAG: bifunctional homocysteine S-methyltransferase/methylenetetrahydrofolate reductase [Candidatus Auribacter fodinae]|uniref:Bifunctional homocysteine S-methyltransferase/methylenetetrahydrofolate reductase n=1 Tax=Candidatus Auribacter fodinae TaxID=2093366 RepID=A0A3A4R7R4_9BACT|nr:MAG: bifunctional homocysteine S-methyltransferase/methylenetetrahydrofolate reductase [Candidatus Auribacter fodinae]